MAKYNATLWLTEIRCYLIYTCAVHCRSPGLRNLTDVSRIPRWSSRKAYRSACKQQETCEDELIDHYQCHDDLDDDAICVVTIC